MSVPGTKEGGARYARGKQLAAGAASAEVVTSRAVAAPAAVSCSVASAEIMTTAAAVRASSAAAEIVTASAATVITTIRKVAHQEVDADKSPANNRADEINLTE
jgi:phosphoenolpyruvate synthase/pyruvate phosphate dikinase